MIFTDGVHLISNESLVELHDFARLIGLNPCWFHSRSRKKHYDLMRSLGNRNKVYLKALINGANRCSKKELIHIIHKNWFITEMVIARNEFSKESAIMIEKMVYYGTAKAS